MSLRSFELYHRITEYARGEMEGVMGAKVKLRKKDRKYLERWLASNHRDECPFIYVWPPLVFDTYDRRYCERYCFPMFPRTGVLRTCPLSCTHPDLVYTEAYVVRKVRKLLEDQ